MFIIKTAYIGQFFCYVAWHLTILPPDVNPKMKLTTNEYKLHK